MTQAMKWKKVRKTLLISLGICLLGVAAFGFWQWGGNAAAIIALSGLCLALGLWVTELLVSVLTGVRKANATAVALLLAGKFLWWGALILGAKWVPAGNEVPIALGIGAFLLSVLVTGIVHYGMPQISEPQG